MWNDTHATDRAIVHHGEPIIHFEWMAIIKRIASLGGDPEVYRYG
tara:strand:- start:29031 stop:29165 length:135 start_codon:yes stop_codon:yes gene_type:complete